MKIKASLLITAALALAGTGIGGGYWYAMQRMGGMTAPQPPAAADAADAAGGAAADGERKPLYWHDPMVPGPKFDKPGPSPFMDMQLVPVYADAGADQGSVTISPRTTQNLGIRTVEVTMGRMNTGLTTVGAVSIDERTMVTVQSRVSGYIEKLHVRAQYDGVARGQPLAEIYAPEWLAAQEEYLALKRSAQAGAGDLAQAARQRLSLLGIDEAQIKRIEQSGKADARVTLFAPVGGLVWELGARDGMAVSPGLTLFRLVSLDSVWINAEIPENRCRADQTRRSGHRAHGGIPGTRFQGQSRDAAARRQCHHAHYPGPHRARQPRRPFETGHVRHAEFRQHGQTRADGALGSGDPHRHTRCRHPC